MAKIPDRFLGFAFSVGDVLIEVDKDFNMLNADGAVSEIGLNNAPDGSLSFLSLLNESELAFFKNFANSLKHSNRLGPIQLDVGIAGTVKKSFALFIGKLPHDDSRFFLVLVSPYKLGVSPKKTAEDREGSKEYFLDKIENILTENKDTNKNLNITLIETSAANVGNEEELNEFEKLLNKYSAGGNSAGRLADNRFVIVHAQKPDGLATSDLLRELTKSTGLELNSTTIDADQDILSEEDGIRALIFSLQQFADQSEGFDVETLADGYDEIVKNTANKIHHLRNILKNGDFTLVYQPIISLINKEVHHHEALIRFNDPKLHNLQFETICFAEEVGLIQEFDKATFKRAVEKIDQVKEHSTPPKLAVNLSGRSLSNKGFLDNLKTHLSDHIHLKDYISLEITESAEIKNIHQLSVVIDEVREMGFKVYLDDFGAGAAGFRYLRELTVDGVKIDGEYVREALVDKKIRAFLRSIVMLCNDLEIETIAEWVETDEQAEFLHSLGVTYAQGYLYGRPNAGIMGIN